MFNNFGMGIIYLKQGLRSFAFTGIFFGLLIAACSPLSEIRVRATTPAMVSLCYGEGVQWETVVSADLPPDDLAGAPRGQFSGHQRVSRWL